MKVILFGTFDHFHPGHQFVFEQAQKRGDVYAVIARDVTVERIKGRLPCQTEKERKKAVENAFPEAAVVLGDDQDYLTPLREINPDLLLFGYDQKLPPGVSEEDLPCPVERLPAFEPERYKSSLLHKSP